MDSAILHFISPPIPYFVDCGYAYYGVGDSHIERNCIQVFDLIVVRKGMLSIGENGCSWKLTRVKDSYYCRTDTTTATFPVRRIRKSFGFIFKPSAVGKSAAT